jgi:hypothetical protein
MKQDAFAARLFARQLGRKSKPLTLSIGLMRPVVVARCETLWGGSDRVLIPPL